MSLSQKTCIGLALTVMLAAGLARLDANSAPVATQADESGSAGMYSLPPSTTMVATAPAEFTNWGLLGSDEETTSSELALVIPDKEMDLATTNQVIEDLGIMSRIIEKNVLTPYGVRQTGWREVFVGGYGSPNTVGPRALFPSRGRPKPLYIAGYGATFFIQVDFPLLAPPEKTQEPPATAQEDPVWAQTKQSLLESRTAGATVRKESGGQPFNQSKVDSFRRSLIATMKHAANIRALGANERLTFVVQGSGSSTAASGQRAGTGVVLPGVGGISFGTSVMTLRATKADVDACGKGQLSPEQFEQRVQLSLSLAGGSAGTATISAAVTYGGAYAGQQWPVATQSNGDAFDNSEGLLQALQVGQGGGPRGRILRTVFVVPGPDMTSEGTTQVTEDLAVMCRIFDKASVWAGRMLPGQTAATIPVDVSGIEIPENRVRTQALYLDGYGAVFFLPVDFPVAAAPQEQTPAKAENSGDPVWSQAANELRGAPQGMPRPAAPKYDPQKVENLRTALIGTLRHAANLRTRQPNDAINIVVTTQQNQAVGRAELLFQQRGLTAITPAEEQTVAPAPTVLILRTTKPDVDAVAKGALTQEQFAAKVQVLKSWTTPTPVESGMGGFGGAMMGGAGWAPLQTR